MNQQTLPAGRSYHVAAPSADYAMMYAKALADFRGDEYGNVLYVGIADSPPRCSFDIYEVVLEDTSAEPVEVGS